LAESLITLKNKSCLLDSQEATVKFNYIYLRNTINVHINCNDIENKSSLLFIEAQSRIKFCLIAFLTKVRYETRVFKHKSHSANSLVSKHDDKWTVVKARRKKNTIRANKDTGLQAVKNPLEKDIVMLLDWLHRFVLNN